MRIHFRSQSLLGIVAAVTLLTAGPAGAQSTASPSAASTDRWGPWLGCWQVIEENIRDEDIDPLAIDAGVASTNSSVLVCVTPTDKQDTVTFTTWIRDKKALEETLTANGQTQSVVESDCRGTQRAEWSTTGIRVFSRSELTCGGLPRSVSGLSMMAAGPTWLDLQLVEADGLKNLRVRRYRRAADQSKAPGVTTRLRSSDDVMAGYISLAGVKEASSKVPAALVEAALVESRASYRLDKARLTDLADGAVPSSVIDLMIALSYPSRFVIDRPASRGSSSSSWGGGWGGGWGDEWSVMGDPLFAPSYYAPFGYRYWNRYDPYYYYGYTPIGEVGGGGRVITEPQPSGRGRVVDGRGYTQIRERAPEPSDSGRVGSRGMDMGSGGSSSTGSSSGGSSGASPAGYSGGSSGGGGDRTAVSRPPGGLF